MDAQTLKRQFLDYGVFTLRSEEAFREGLRSMLSHKNILLDGSVIPSVNSYLGRNWAPDQLNVYALLSMPFIFEEFTEALNTGKVLMTKWDHQLLSDASKNLEGVVRSAHGKLCQTKDDALKALLTEEDATEVVKQYPQTVLPFFTTLQNHHSLEHRMHETSLTEIYDRLVDVVAAINQELNFYKPRDVAPNVIADANAKVAYLLFNDLTAKPGESTGFVLENERLYGFLMTVYSILTARDFCEKHNLEENLWGNVLHSESRTYRFEYHQSSYRSVDTIGNLVRRKEQFQVGGLWGDPLELFEQFLWDDMEQISLLLSTRGYQAHKAQKAQEDSLGSKA
ncbi:hypothetical protein HZB01_04990 [Candidatus Woesearchaeota archaeon]|nr:hypothetical protein [Candidatus Woesearchaeota archaeon]